MEKAELDYKAHKTRDLYEDKRKLIWERKGRFMVRRKIAIALSGG